MYTLSLNHNELDFNTIEKEIYKIVCEVGRGIMKDILENIDLRILASRDTKKYRSKGFRKTYIHTIMGEVEYKRRIYK